MDVTRTPVTADLTATLDRYQSQAALLSFCLRDEASARRLDGAVSPLHEVTELRAVLPRILEGALRLTGADFGNVQLLDPDTGALVIAAESGFDAEFLEYFAVVDDDSSACGRAAQQRAQTVIADVKTDHGFRPHREIAASSGFRAVQSTPLIDPDGYVIGMLSTHFRRPGPPLPRDLRTVRFYGQLAGEALARWLDPGMVAAPRIPEMEFAWSTDPALTDAADTAINGIFSASLSLASTQATITDRVARQRVATAINELDEAIRQIQATLVEIRG